MLSLNAWIEDERLVVGVHRIAPMVMQQVAPGDRVTVRSVGLVFTLGNCISGRRQE